MGEGGRSVVESRVRETAQWRYGGKPLTFPRRAKAVRSHALFAFRTILLEEKFEVCPHVSTGLSRRLGSPLRSARWPASAPVEMTGFFEFFPMEVAIHFLGIRSGMEIDFRRSLPLLREQSAERRLRHAPRFAQTANSIRETDAARDESRTRPRAERRKDVAEQAARRRLAEEAREGEAVLASDRQREIENGGMQMQMRVAVPIRRRKSERAKFFKLRADFRGERGGERRAEEVAQASFRG